MSDWEDYENNLAFDPAHTVKSEDDIKKPEQRSVDVLTTALDKCQQLEAKLNIAVKALEFYAERIILNQTGDKMYFVDDIAKKALQKIKGDEN